MSERDGRPALKPCPFCGGASRVYCNDNGNNEWIARCRNLLTCGHRGSAWLTEAEAINSWNRRAALAAPVAAPPVPSVPPAEPAAASSITPREVAHQVFEVCEDFEATPESPGDSQEVERFKAGVRFASKRIRNAIGDWLTEEERATAQPAPAAVPAVTYDDFYTLQGHAVFLHGQGQTDMPAYFFDLAARIAPDKAHADRAREVYAQLLAAAPQQAPTGGAE